MGREWNELMDCSNYHYFKTRVGVGGMIVGSGMYCRGRNQLC